MAKGDFVWCDLSTFRPPNTKSFYAELFGWTYESLKQPDGSDYDVAATPSGEVAGLFEMPNKFQEIGLPSFWMPYISVDDVEATFAIAAEHGGRIEVKPTAWSESDTIALIRDPLGAGFTVHHGTGLSADATVDRHGHRIGCALYVSDVDAVRPFYEALFDWRIATERTSSGAFPVRNAQGAVVADIYELSEDRRGKYQFWGIHFAVADLAKASNLIQKNGGEIVERDQLSGEPTVLAKDPDGAAFFLNTLPAHANRTADDSAHRGLATKWKTVLGLLILYVAVLFEQTWVWGALFIFWTALGLRAGETFFVETVRRRDNPILYWLIIATWIGLSLYLIATDFIRPGGT